jgi:hypothetical protein
MGYNFAGEFSIFCDKTLLSGVRGIQTGLPYNNSFTVLKLGQSIEHWLD